MKRRAFITLCGAAAAPQLLPRAARAQQPAMQVVGFLNSQSHDSVADRMGAFRQGLKESGHVEGENVAIEYRWAENQIDRLPELAGDLVRRRVAVIAAMSNAASAAAKSATETIPVVFSVGEDPVRLGLVASLGRPGGNLTGVNFFTTELAAKRLELLRELVPTAMHVAVLVNPANSVTAASDVREAEAGARAMGLQIQVLRADTSSEINAAFAILARERPDALLVGAGPFFSGRRVQLAQLAARHALPAIYATRQFPDVGGLISYGASNTDAWRQVGVYVGRILKGAKPANLPVLQSTKFELVINAETARMLALNVPPTLLSTADEVIE